MTATPSHPTPGYTLTKTSNPADGATVQPGDTVTYTLTVTNTSDAVVNTTVTDDLSDVLDNAAIGTIGTGGVLTGTTLTWTIANLAPDAVTTLTYTVTVDADAFNQTLGNVATPGPGGECVEPDDCITEHPTPGYTLTKTSDPADGATVEPGDTVTYTLTVTNTSDAVVNTTVTDDLSDVLDNATIGHHRHRRCPDRHHLDLDHRRPGPGCGDDPDLHRHRRRPTPSTRPSATSPPPDPAASASSRMTATPSTRPRATR